MSSTTRTPASRRNPIRKAVAAVAIAVMSVAGMTALTGSPASAATSVTFCFQHNGGGAYANSPVYLYRVNASGSPISLVRNGKTGANGCATFYNTPSNVYLRVQARNVIGNYQIGQAVYSGWSPFRTNTGSGLANVGTGRVYRSCTPGLYDNLCAYL